MKKKVAVFGLGYDQIYGLKELKKNYQILGFDNNTKSPGIKYVNKYYAIGLEDKKKILQICKKNKIIACFSFSTEYPIILLGWINKKLKLPGFSLKTARYSRNKDLLRKHLKKNNILTPDFKYYSLNEFKKKIIFFKKKKIFKPVNGSASIGVFSCKNYKKAINILKSQEKFYKSGLVVEDCLNGTMYAIDGWIKDNKLIFGCLSKKYKDYPNSYLDKKIIFNYKNKYIEEKGKKLLRKCYETIKATDVPVHFEFMKVKNLFYPIDIAIRGAGSFVYSYLLKKIINQSTANIQVNLQLKKDIFINNNNKKIFYIYFIGAKMNDSYKIRKSLRLIKKKIKCFFSYKSLNSTSDTSHKRSAVAFFYFNNQKQLLKNKKFIDLTMNSFERKIIK